MTEVFLTDYDKELLSGSHGKSKKISMEIILEIAKIQGAKKLIDISNAHIDGCLYLGKTSIEFPKRLADDENGKVVVPTTMNAISIDRKRWQTYHIDKKFAENAYQVALEYERMGAIPTFSCAPYQLPNAPKFGEHIAWAESNAIVYANSVIGARTNRYGDFMDICAALTGRVPLSGHHLDEERLGTVLIRLPKMKTRDASFYPLLGYLIGEKIENGIPVIDGIHEPPTNDDLKALGAALATTGSIGMFHMVGVTPEAPTVEEAFGFRSVNQTIHITVEEIESLKSKLLPKKQEKVSMVLLGSPHFSIEEFKELLELVDNKKIHPDVRMMMTTSAYVYEEIEKLGIVNKIEDFGAEIITDSCLCMIEPFIRDIIKSRTGIMITNSGKFVHYGPGLTKSSNGVFLSSLNGCVQSAISGKS